MLGFRFPCAAPNPTPARGTFLTVSWPAVGSLVEVLTIGGLVAVRSCAKRHLVGLDKPIKNLDLFASFHLNLVSQGHFGHGR